MAALHLPLASIQPGSPYPLGATYDGTGTNFAVFSAHAERIELCFFDATGRHELARCALPECTNEVWHGYLPGVHPGALYGYRAYGPYQPEQGHRFNPNKLLLDPYAKRLSGQVRWADTLYGYRIHSPRADLSFDHRDSAPSMPKAVVANSTFHWHGDAPPRVPWERTVIYETHVRGMTLRAPRVPADERGSFAGLANPWVIDYLVKLGITAVELLPVHAVLQDRRLLASGLANYWGYNTLSFFCPEPRYLSSGSPDEMRHAVRQLHAAGIEVILDVVYNHTCEESELGPTLSLRGLDNASYYRLQDNNLRHNVNDTGCGNTLNMSHPRVIQMVMDSLRYWVQEFHVDGFRFDLGATLGREHHGFDPGSGFFDALLQDPALAGVKLISEPWDLGPGGYQVGNHPPGIAEWNDRFRDDVRSFWRGDPGMRGAIASRLLGSADLFNHHRRRSWASVNFVTAHDGFTLQDLVSYNQKHNEANLEENRDGSNENRSCNWGEEGPTASPKVLATREKVKRAMLMTLLLANGTPMLLGGDEFGRSQNGNNNPYCQESDISWFDWSLLDTEAGCALLDFTRRCIALRRELPTLCSTRFLKSRPKTMHRLPDISWFDETGEEMTPERWHFAEGRLLALRRTAGNPHAGTVSASLLLLNAFSEDREFDLPKPEMPWQVLLDAAEQSHGGGRARAVQHNRIRVFAHSALLLIAEHVTI
ncbi:glycogen debranching protein GlgX [Noviherbaspirillum autotrophicum]|uniref:Glycogen debranching protein n=1 Tax=Noviherbaspirillum autotrophicum TaxID=709839 RepID=A0A0C1Y1C7_9BURK|nr:glycogen debranching protein GlgX [Noviherbaspirillum autotrophicum]KIF80868.1 glycogen debranching protein [Noviherbaspirillum autotrophicum]